MSAIKKNVGERCLFSGGNEFTPEVEVVNSAPGGPFSLKTQEKVLSISQNGQKISISVETLQSIIDWAKRH